MNKDEIEQLRIKLQASFDLLVSKIGKIQIGTKKLFPYGWRKAAKGRTVWRILEEIITQNLELHHGEFNLDKVIPSESEVSIFDFECKLKGVDTNLYVNIKSAVEGGRKNKDDISKAEGLKLFYDSDSERNFFAATFFIKFNEDMSIEITKAVVFPIAWLPDIYVNPSNNGNLQSAYFKDITHAKRRSNSEFITLLNDAIDIALEKKRNKK